MEEQWDVDINIDSLSTEERIAENDRQLERRWEEEREGRERERARRGYFDLPPIPENVIRAHFSHYTHVEIDPQYHVHSYPWSWTAGRMIWVCHNCGSFGYKYSLHELFKCYCCGSRDVTVCKSGELSLAIRNNRDVGVRMEEVYENRRNRLAEERRIRRENSNFRG